MADLDSLTVTELRERAAAAGVTGYTKLKKSDLVDAIRSVEASKKAVKPKAAPQKPAATQPAKTTATKAPARPRKAPAAPAGTPVAALPIEVRDEDEPASVREVTAAKFDHGRAVLPAIPEEDLGVLPAGYAEDRLVLVPRDPEWTFVYWEMTEATWRKGAAAVPHGRLVLRMQLDTPEGIVGAELELPPGSSRWYTRTEGGAWIVAELGLKGPGDTFHVLLRSDRTRLPTARPKPGEPRFVTVPFDVPLKTLRHQGHAAGGWFVSAEGRLLSEAEYRRLFGKGWPGSLRDR